LGQKLPNAEVLVVTTPQQAAAEVAERAGTMASMMNQRVIGVVENMSYLAVTCPHCGEEQRHDVFGSGGGESVAQGLTTRLGYPVPVLAQVPLDPRMRASGDVGSPIVVEDPETPAAKALQGLADGIAARGRNLLGRQLGLSPV
jgi:ATP-binding protein involved in chromosome partitioning